MSDLENNDPTTDIGASMAAPTAPERSETGEGADVESGRTSQDAETPDRTGNTVTEDETGTLEERVETGNIGQPH